MATINFNLRPAEPGDVSMLYGLHVAAMRESVSATWGWDDAWQDRDFHRRFSPKQTSIILVRGEVVGMIEVANRPGELYLHNIKIDPRFQGKGIGSDVLCWLISTATDRGAPVRLQVLRANTRARRLYERLGFRETGSNTTHIQMERPALI